jgi:hypothetical protein
MSSLACLDTQILNQNMELKRDTEVDVSSNTPDSGPALVLLTPAIDTLALRHSACSSPNEEEVAAVNLKLSPQDDSVADMNAPKITDTMNKLAAIISEILYAPVGLSDSAFRLRQQSVRHMHMTIL